MGSLGRPRTWRLCGILAVTVAVIGVLVAFAAGAGPGGWDHLGDHGTPGSDSLDLVASALAATPGALYVGGGFTDAGGNPDADRIAKWNGSSLERGQLVDVVHPRRRGLRHRRRRRQGLCRRHLPQRRR